jgi:hypothetical protein
VCPVRHLAGCRYADLIQDDDPFFSEVSSFIDCIEGGPDPHILSSFEDAVSLLRILVMWNEADNCRRLRLTSELRTRRRAI